jgi:antitoxin component of MazEF toxin-antitoxin module
MVQTPMGDQTNPRKVTTSGGMIVVSLPTDLLAEVGLEKGDRVVLTPTETGFKAERVTWEVAGDE